LIDAHKHRPETFDAGSSSSSLDDYSISRLLDSEGSSLIESSSATKMIFAVLNFSPAWQDSPKIDPSQINSTPVAGDAQPSSL
jgi:hypothetical protein